MCSEWEEGVSSVWAGHGHWGRGAERLEGPWLCLGPSLVGLPCLPGGAETAPGLSPSYSLSGRVPAARPLLKLGKSSGPVVIFISNCLFFPFENVVGRNEISDVCVSALIFLFVITHPAYLL